MKSAKETVLSVWKVWVWVCTLSVTSALLLALGVLLFISIWSGFSAHFLQIDSCLDAGGRWIEKQNICEK